MYTGAVKWFDSKKGFGFIVGPEGQDVFVHFSVIQGDGFRSLKDGEQVNYEVEKGPKGMLAKAVYRITPPKEGDKSQPPPEEQQPQQPITG
jgi:CspA family cold shock protein